MLEEAAQVPARLGTVAAPQLLGPAQASLQMGALQQLLLMVLVRCALQLLLLMLEGAAHHARLREGTAIQAPAQLLGSAVQSPAHLAWFPLQQLLMEHLPSQTLMEPLLMLMEHLLVLWVHLLVLWEHLLVLWEHLLVLWKHLLVLWEQ